MSTDRNPLSDKELWQRFAAAPAAAPATASKRPKPEFSCDEPE